MKKSLFIFIALLISFIILNNKQTITNFEDFTLKDLYGNTHNTKDLRKDKIAIFKFGATWCPPCNKQIDHLKMVYNSYDENKVVIIDVNSKEDIQTVREHNKKHSISYLTLYDDTNSVFSKFKIKSIPKVIILNKNSEIIYDGGLTEFSTFKNILDKNL
jgi:thiol-disulfide isomerase/thioredoxin